MRRLPLAALAFLAAPLAAQEPGAPLSAIDWLSQSVSSSSAAPPPGEPPVAATGASPGITVTPLDRPSEAPIGLLGSEVTGLPPDLWARSDIATLAGLIHADPADTLPALQELQATLMLAAAEPPADATARDFLLLRADKLLAMGALEAARSLLESADLLDPEVFRRWFDVTLLTGTEHDACAILRSQPSLAPTLPARVFCLARNGDWNAAALTLSTARALGDVTPDEDLLLASFLDPELTDPEAAAPATARPSPLTYRLREAVGDIMPTTGLPLAFAHADLRDTVAWRAQIEAAERLARHGALSENALLGVYTARAPAASGGVWDRAAAIQRLDDAVTAGDAAAVALALPPAWEAMRAVGLEVALGRLFGERLLTLGLTGEPGRIAFALALLSPAFAAAAQNASPSGTRERFWQAVALGQVEGLRSPDAPTQAVLAGFANPELPSDLSAAVGEGRVGEALLRAVERFQMGLDGDLAGVTQAVALLRAAGLEEAARRAALQYLVLGARD